jgi:ABC-type oligopeptide transport system ATPase subunit
MADRAPVLELDRLIVSFSGRGQGASAFRAVDEVSLALHAGEVLGLVGESGSGKTTLGKAVLRLYRPSGGRILFQGRDIGVLGERELRSLRRNMQMVFQDPISSFNPRQRIGEALGIPLRLHGVAAGRQMIPAIVALLRRVGLPESFVGRYPHELSGGQLQRVAIARALCPSPAFVVADEPVSKLDVSVRAQILNLFRDLQRQTGVALLFITHDLRVARYLCDRIAVMYRGKIVESGPAESIFSAPSHAYTRLLLGYESAQPNAPPVE